MERYIKVVKDNDIEKSLVFVEKVFSDSEGEKEGKLVKDLVKEIRSKRFYEPRLDLIMVNENDEIIGFVLFSRFSIEGKYENELLLLSPVAVKTELQRQHISKELIEYGLNKAKQLGYKAVLVEGNPRNYHSRGFKTSADYGIHAHKKIHLPSIECLMILELEEGYLSKVKGYVNYDFYKALR